MKHDHSSSDHHPSVDMVTLGERGQVVIPAAMREQMDLQPGDKLMVFMKHGKMIGLVPPAHFRSWVDKLARQLSELEDKAGQ